MTPFEGFGPYNAEILKSQNPLDLAILAKFQCTGHFSHSIYVKEFVFNLDFRNYQFWDTFPKFLGHWEIFGTKAVFCQNQHMGHQISLIFVMKFDYELRLWSTGCHNVNKLNQK